MDHYSSFYYNLFWNMQGVGVQVRPHKKIHVLVFQSTIVRLFNLTKIFAAVRCLLCFQFQIPGISSFCPLHS